METRQTRWLRLVANVGGFALAGAVVGALQRQQMQPYFGVTTSAGRAARIEAVNTRHQPDDLWPAHRSSTVVGSSPSTAGVGLVDSRHDAGLDSGRPVGRRPVRSNRRKDLRRWTRHRMDTHGAHRRAGRSARRPTAGRLPMARPATIHGPVGRMAMAQSGWLDPRSDGRIHRREAWSRRGCALVAPRGLSIGSAPRGRWHTDRVSLRAGDGTEPPTIHCARTIPCAATVH